MILCIHASRHLHAANLLSRLCALVAVGQAPVKIQLLTEILE